MTDNFLKKLFILCCRMIPQKPLAAFAQYRKGSGSQKVHVFFGASSKYEKSVFPREWFTEMAELPFEDSHYPVPAHYHELLTALYGDYMVPTPENKRGCKVHGEIVDLEHSYESYFDMIRTLQFREYSRSIR